MLNRVKYFACALAAAVASGPAMAQEYPAKPVTFYVPFAAGSATDTLARSLGQGITGETRQNVVIDNRAGANGIIATQAFIRTPADGYTVLIATNTTHAANENLYKKIPYHPVNDFTPVTTIARGGQVMFVHPSVRAMSVWECWSIRVPGPDLSRNTRVALGSGSAIGRR